MHDFVEGAKSAFPSTITGALRSFSLLDAKNVPYILGLCATRTALASCNHSMAKVPAPSSFVVLPSLVFLTTLGALVHTVHQRKREEIGLIYSDSVTTPTSYNLYA